MWQRGWRGGRREDGDCCGTGVEELKWEVGRNIGVRAVVGSGRRRAGIGGALEEGGDRYVVFGSGSVRCVGTGVGGWEREGEESMEDFWKEVECGGKTEGWRACRRVFGGRPERKLMLVTRGGEGSRGLWAEGGGQGVGVRRVGERRRDGLEVGRSMGEMGGSRTA